MHSYPCVKVYLMHNDSPPGCFRRLGSGLNPLRLHAEAQRHKCTNVSLIKQVEITKCIMQMNTLFPSSQLFPSFQFPVVSFIILLRYMALVIMKKQIQFMDRVFYDVLQLEEFSLSRLRYG